MYTLLLAAPEHRATVCFLIVTVARDFVLRRSAAGRSASLAAVRI